MTSRIIVFYYLLFTGYEGLIVDGRSAKATYRFSTCGSRGREGPTMMECTQHYCNNGSLVCGHLLDEGTRGSQMFVVPRSGNYTVTIAGANGGHGVCSNYSGLGVIARNTVKFRRGEMLRILVGQQGVSVCDGHQDVDVCRLSDDSRMCGDLWMTKRYFVFDGGGGGGGASLIENVDTKMTGLPIAITPGGGGAAAIYNKTTYLPLLNVSSTFADLETLYENYTNGNPFESVSMLSNGTIGQYFVNGAGPGAGYHSIFIPSDLDPHPLNRKASGGRDCSYVFHDIHELLLSPNTDGGFGGGGGGCDNGGGGGGYTGGSVLKDSVIVPGEGGYSWPDPPWPLIGYNDGDGYVELFLESCGCTYYCNMLNESSFECSCPPDTSLAPNGLDCYKEESIFIESEVDLITFSHSMYGEVTASIATFGTIFTYSTIVSFSNESSSDCCAVLFLNNVSSLVATTKFINRSAEAIGLKLFTVNTIVSEDGSVTANVSINALTVLQEPLSFTSVVTFGIDGNCILDKLVANTSIDDIVEYHSNKSVNITSTRILHAYLDSFSPSSSNDNFFTTTVLIGITVCGSVVVMAVILMIVCLCVILRRRRKRIINFDLVESYVEYNIEDYQKICNNKCTLNVYSQELWYSGMNSYQYSQLHPAYENTNMDGDKHLEVQESMRQRCDTLKYGLESPQHDYYHFNCSRQNYDWSYDRAKLIYMREIGEGQFGKVLLMTAKDICGVKGSVLVAVKTLTSRNPKDISRFSKEMSLMKRFIHPNIVSLLGHCEATSDGAPLMILELMQYGDLKWFLAENRPHEGKLSVITVSITLSIIFDIASALEYLATNKFVHRDVAARNCLLGAHFKAKLADFGLACSVHEKDSYEVAAKTLLPVRWAAPESLVFGKFTTASDVWSFGVLVWEVATYGETPYKQLQTSDIMAMARDESLKLDSPAECPVILADLIAWCTRIKLNERPSFTELMECCSRKQQ